MLLTRAAKRSMGQATARTIRQSRRSTATSRSSTPRFTPPARRGRCGEECDSVFEDTRKTDSLPAAGLRLSLALRPPLSLLLVALLPRRPLPAFEFRSQRQGAVQHA